MKKQIALFALVAASLVAAPAVLRAEDKPAAPATGSEAPPHSAPKHGGAPFRGKVASVDTAASTVTVGKMTISVTSETKITKDSHPATLSEIAVGEKISGYYKKDDAGKLNATFINIAKTESKKPKKAETHAGNN